MALTSDQIMDRRRLRRKLGFWRLAAVLLVLLAVILAWGRYGGTFMGDHIATLALTGTIYEDPRWDDRLEPIAENDSVKAVLLEINSPGGTTVGSEKLYNGLRDISESKPVVAVIGTLGASGAYIAALGADHIIAHETSLTGSIGVIMQTAEVSELLGKIGVSVTNLKSGPYKAEPTPTAPMSDDVRAYMQNLITQAHQWFKGLVAERRQLSAEAVDAVADGRVFTGGQALDLGLVDEIGGDPQALRWLETEHGIDPALPQVDMTPREELTFIDRTLGSALGKVLSSERLRLDGLLTLWQP
jgi:protease-4